MTGTGKRSGPLAAPPCDSSAPKVRKMRLAGMSYSQIANRLSCNLNTVRKIVKTWQDREWWKTGKAPAPPPKIEAVSVNGGHGGRNFGYELSAPRAGSSTPQVRELFLAGKDHKQIASELHLSESTVCKSINLWRKRPWWKQGGASAAAPRPVRSKESRPRKGSLAPAIRTLTVDGWAPKDIARALRTQATYVERSIARWKETAWWASGE